MEDTRAQDGPLTRQETHAEIVERIMSLCLDLIADTEVDLMTNPKVKPKAWIGLTKAYNNLYVRTHPLIKDDTLKAKVHPNTCTLDSCLHIRRYIQALQNQGFASIGLKEATLT